MNSHRHRCPKCKHVWQHPDSICDSATETECILVHTCPNCGHLSRDGVGTWNKYYGDKPADSKFRGLRHNLAAIKE